MAESAAVKKKKSKFRFPLWQKGVRYGEVDLAFLLIVIALLVIGIIMMFSASYAWAIAEGMDGSYYAVQQMKTAAIGLVIMYVLSVVDYHVLKSALVATLSYLIPLILLVMVLLVGSSAGGATRWLQIGPINFQPSELMKIGIVIFFSFLIEKNYDRMQQFRYGIMPYMIALALVAGLMMMQPHLSGTLLISLISITLIFVGGARLMHFAIMGIAGAVGIISVVLYLSIVNGYGYFQTRIQSWLDPFADSLADLSVLDCNWFRRFLWIGIGRIPSEVFVSAGDQKRLCIFHCLRRAGLCRSFDRCTAVCISDYSWFSHCYPCAG